MPLSTKNRLQVVLLSTTAGTRKLTPTKLKVSGTQELV
jgi:hypothetical protein